MPGAGKHWWRMQNLSIGCMGQRVQGWVLSSSQQDALKHPQGMAEPFALLWSRMGNPALGQGWAAWSILIGTVPMVLHGAMHWHQSQHELAAGPGTGKGFGSGGAGDSELAGMWEMQPGCGAT